MAGPRALILTAALALAGAAGAGCTDIGGLSIAADDRIAQPGQTIRVVARIERKGLSRWFPPTSPPPVRIYRDNRLLAEHRPTLLCWEFATEVTLEAPGEHAIDAVYQARPDHRPMQATCYAYCWDASKVGVVVDFDGVVNHTTALDRVLGDRPLADPREGAPAVLTALAREFYICYVTELGGEMKEDIRDWLRRKDLPTGPIFNWDRGNRYTLNPGNQSAVLAELREQVPTLLIGVGDGNDDLAAFAANQMLPVMISYTGRLRAPLNVPRCRSWQDVWQLFTLEANHPILTDPKVMLDLHYRGGDYVEVAGTGRSQ